MTFYGWIIKNHIRDHSPVGDLARDMRDDREFPHRADKQKILDYLEYCGACDGCMDAFGKAWAEYERKND